MSTLYKDHILHQNRLHKLNTLRKGGLADFEECVFSHKFFQEHLVLCEAFEASPLEVLGSQGFKEHKQQQGKLFYLSFKLEIVPHVC